MFWSVPPQWVWSLLQIFHLDCWLVSWQVFCPSVGEWRRVGTVMINTSQDKPVWAASCPLKCGLKVPRTEPVRRFSLIKSHLVYVCLKLFVINDWIGIKFGFKSYLWPPLLHICYDWLNRWKVVAPPPAVHQRTCSYVMRDLIKRPIITRHILTGNQN